LFIANAATGTGEPARASNVRRPATGKASVSELGGR
jgi:hypothetical protein